MYKRVASVIVLGICILGWSTGVVGEQVLAPRGELRIVDKNPQN
jgi:hypothetical protein